MPDEATNCRTMAYRLRTTANAWSAVSAVIVLSIVVSGGRNGMNMAEVRDAAGTEWTGSPRDAIQNRSASTMKITKFSRCGSCSAIARRVNAVISRYARLTSVTA